MSQHAEPVGRFYAFLRLAARFWIWFLFREVAVREAGRVPSRGPVLLCVNHPNNLIDSLLVAAALPRKVHYLANASLFRNPILARFLARAGAIPVYRRQDDPDRPDRNVEAFAASRQALAAGHVLAIYPEGTTHAETRVQRIKTGAARIALDYETARATAQAAEVRTPLRRSSWFRSGSPSRLGSPSGAGCSSPSGSRFRSVPTSRGRARSRWRPSRV